jgi:hypothetical protein
MPVKPAGSSPWRWSAAIVCAVVLGVSLHIGTFLIYRPWREATMRTVTLTTDAIWYHTLASNLARGNGYSAYPAAPFAPHCIVSPLFPATVAGLYRLSVVHPAVGVAYNVLLAIVNCILFYFVVRAWCGDRQMATVGLYLIVLCPTFIAFSNSLVIEQTFVFWLLLASWAMLRFLRAPSCGAATLVGLLLGMVNLAKFSALFTPVLFGLAFLVFAGGGAWRRRVVYCVYIGAVFYCCVLPWQLRNYVRTGNFVYTINSQVYPLFFNMAEFRAVALQTNREDVVRQYAAVIARRTGAAFQPVTNTPVYWQIERGWAPAEYHAAARLFKEELSRSYLPYALFHFSRLHIFLLSVPAHEWGRQLGFSERELDRANRYLMAGDLPGLWAMAQTQPGLVLFFSVVTVLGTVYLVVLYCGALIGLFAAYRAGGVMRVMTVFWVLFAVFIVVAVGPLPSSRYRNPSEPGLMALASVGLVTLWRLRSRRGMAPSRAA